tara:strand:- start:154 stop:774 length:621 start_codon:yes stop_codon:yes gene_type:complete
MANRKFEKWKTYRRGGQRVPGMFKRQEGGDTGGGKVKVVGGNQSDAMPQTQMGSQELARKAYGPSGMPQSRYSPGIPMKRNIPSRQEMANLSLSNAIKEEEVQRTNIVNERMTEMIMQMKLQNESLQQQNQLLKTQIEKSDLINSARNTKQKVGSDNSPKRRGGSVKAKRGKEKRIMFTQSSGATMRHGGSCGGPLKSMMKRTKRR